MGYLGLSKNVLNPSEATLKWKGADTYEGKDRLVFYDKETEKEVGVSKEFDFGVIGISFSITGGRTEGRTYVPLYSNEVIYTGNWNETIDTKVVVRDKNGVVSTDKTIRELSEGSPAEYRRTINLYIYNFTTKRVERFLGVGSLQTPIRSMLFSNDEFKGTGAIDEVIYTFTKETKTDKNGAVKFHIPIIKVAREQSEEEAKILEEASAPVVEFLAHHADKAVSETSDGKDHSKDKQSEVVEVAEEDDTIDLSDVPF